LTQTYCKNKTNHQNLLKNKRPFSKIFQNNSRLGFFPETLFNNPWNKKTNYPFLKEQAFDNQLITVWIPFQELAVSMHIDLVMLEG